MRPRLVAKLGQLALGVGAALSIAPSLRAQTACPVDRAQATRVSVHFAGLLVAVDSARLAALGVPRRVSHVEPVTDRAECAAALGAYNQIRYPMAADTAEHLREALVLRVDSVLYLVVDDRADGQVAVLSRGLKWLMGLTVPK